MEKSFQEMSALKLILLSFVGICLWDSFPCTNAAHSTVSTKDLKDLNKYLTKAYQDQVFKRRFLTEEMTCNEVDRVLKVMREEMESDLNLLMADVRNHLRLPYLNITQRRCVRNIEEEIGDAVKEGVRRFSKCTWNANHAITNIKDGVVEKQKQYEENFKYILQGLDRCLLHNNKYDWSHWFNCTQPLFNYRINDMTASHEIFMKSKCMDYFENKILSCVSDVYGEFIEKIKTIEFETKNCVGYLSLNSVHENIKENIKSNVSFYTSQYEMSERTLTDTLSLHFKDMCMWNTLGDKTQKKEKVYYDQVYRQLLPYYETLKKSLNENWRENETMCAKKAISILDKLVLEATNDYTQCYKNMVEKHGDILKNINTAIIDFNSKFTESGNVALLKCFGQRPQQVTDSDMFAKCSELSWRNSVLEWEMLHATLSELKEFESKNPTSLILGLTDEGMETFGIEDLPCGKIIKDRLALDADTALYECQKCLYGENGNYYDVTTPRILIPTEKVDKTTTVHAKVEGFTTQPKGFPKETTSKMTSY